MLKNIFVRYALYSIFLLVTIPFSLMGQLMKAKEIYNKADSLRGTLTELRTCYDVIYYHLDVKVDIENKFISGSNLFKFLAVSDFSKLQFDLFDNLSVDRIVYKDQNLDFTREFNAVFVDFPNVIKEGVLDSFVVYYSGHPIQATRAPWDGGFDWKTDRNGKPFVATACQGLGASVWWPNKDHQSDEADSMLISVSVPSDLMNVSNGRLLKIEDVEPGYKKFYWKVENPINNYNVALNIGDYVNWQETYQGEKGALDLSFFILKENNSKKNRSHLSKNVNQTLEALEHWFGPYPFYEDGYKIIETAHLGMEHQSAIAYGNKFGNGYLGRDGSGTGWGKKWDFIVVHESGHEWFGNSITAKDLADMWIHESFTNYSEALFIDYFYGKEASQSYVNGNRFAIKNDRSLQGAYHVNKEGSGDMYNKGGVIHNMIRTMLEDDDRWRELLRGMNERYYHQQVDYNDIVDYMIDKSGIDLSKFFEQYVQYSNVPVLDLHFRNGELFGRWISDVPDFSMPVHIGVVGKGRKLFRLDKELKKVNLDGVNKENIDVDVFNYYIGLLMQ